MRVFVFRPRPDADRTAQAIAAHGFEPLVAPLFEVVRLPGEAPAGDFAAIVLTSGNAVPVLAEGPEGWRELPVFTVGARTAAKVREAGLDDARSADGDRNDLIELITRTVSAPARLLLILGRDRKEDVPQRLKDAGYDITLWEAYAAEPVSVLPEDTQAALRHGRADAALHYSARGARTFLSLAQAAGVGAEALELTHVALSADVASPLISAGASTVLVAEHPEEAAMLAALEEVSRRQKPDGSAQAEPRGSLKRTPPTIDLKPQPQPEADAGEAAPERPSPEAVAPTEALPQEFSPPPPEPPRAAAAAPVAKATMPWPALAIAGVLGGVLGAGLMLYALRASSPAVTPEQLADLSGRVDGLQASVTAADRKAGTAGDAAAKAGSELQALSGRIGSLAKAPAADTGALTEQLQRTEAALAATSERFDKLTGRVSAIETQAKATPTANTEGMAAARIVLAERVQRALAAGRPFGSDVAALVKAGVPQADVAALSAVATAGSATREALLAGFRTHGAMFQREVTPQSDSWTDKLIGLTSRIVTVRPVGDNSSNDPATLPLRLESAVAAGDMPKAAALWGQLPEPARRASAEFGADLQKRAAADAAIAKIAQDAVAALGAAG
ncbi:uroporphyrinogen-III synthase [Bosea sp. SSUT16]|uniref:Uroporphyrinogen-III synthase n=1 Tax=Bosea spartocytisi TaxID=2773451 RepID=A0A927E970_9HYPH|nr:uroporphyrinogen-III synthase [Bosea spartocytisi]MBD3847041.1 uroporphyrinogen-III synthase [Bosea spartocytisi]MCT4474474.1 uroporphyrinogen-III synthase [Bosea spartocytisi]